MEENRPNPAGSQGRQPPYSAPNPAPQPPVRTRRVGAFTLGLGLILIGALLVARVVYPALDAVTVLKFAPALLIVLGVEVLLAAREKNTHLKYDGVSIFLCLIMLCAGSCALAVDVVLQRLGYSAGYEELITKESDAMRREAYESIGTTGGVANIEVVMDYSLDLVKDGELDADRARQNARASVKMCGDYADKAAFAAACRQVLDAANAGGLEFAAYNFWMPVDQEDGAAAMELSVEGPWETLADESTLAGLVRETWWFEYNEYDSRSEYDAATAESARLAAQEAVEE